MLLKAEQPVHRRAISLTPLIDVVFILLLFFMLSSTFIQWRQIDVSAPSQAENDVREQRLVTLVSDKGEFRLGDQTFSVADGAAIEKLIAAAPQAVYIIKVEPGLRTQSMIDLLDAFKLAGAGSVTLAGVTE